MDKQTIVLTGGHAATTAIAVVEEIVRRSGSGGFTEIYWIGSKSAVEGQNIPTLESLIFPRLGVKYRAIDSGRIQMKFTRWTIPALLKIPWGFLNALTLLREIRPRIILSFGGAAAFPVVVVGRLLGIPIVIHEQTAAVGRANRYSGCFAARIALARPSSEKYFPRGKCVVVGNPLMTQIVEIQPKKILGKPPTIYVTGGSRGARRINDLIEKILKPLLADFYIIHHSGRLDFEKFNRIKKELPANLRDRYEVYAVIDPLKVDGVYRQADLVIGRAGANTVAEIMAVKRPALLIPIPWSYLNEQAENARFAEKYGLVRVLDQTTLMPEILLAEVQKLKDDWPKIVAEVSGKISPDLKAAEKLVELVSEVVVCRK